MKRKTRTHAKSSKHTAYTKEKETEKQEKLPAHRTKFFSRSPLLFCCCFKFVAFDSFLFFSFSFLLVVLFYLYTFYLPASLVFFLPFFSNPSLFLYFSATSISSFPPSASSTNPNNCKVERMLSPPGTVSSLASVARPMAVIWRVAGSKSEKKGLSSAASTPPMERRAKASCICFVCVYVCM